MFRNICVVIPNTQIVIESVLLDLLSVLWDT